MPSPESPAPPVPIRLSRDEINRLPLFHYEGEIVLLGTDAAVSEALPRLAREPALGFDTETRACFRKGESYPPALIQLAAADAVYVIQLRELSDLGWFDVLFGDERIAKAGVSIAYDVKQLRALHEFAPAGFVDLARLSDQAGIRNNGLRGLAAAVLGVRISKGARCSDWSCPRLSHAQLVYAATDAFVGRELYLRLTGEKP